MRLQHLLLAPEGPWCRCRDGRPGWPFGRVCCSFTPPGLPTGQRSRRGACV